MEVGRGLFIIVSVAMSLQAWVNSGNSMETPALRFIALCSGKKGPCWPSVMDLTVGASYRLVDVHHA